MGETVTGVQKVVMAREACKAVVKLQQAGRLGRRDGFRCRRAVGRRAQRQGINKDDTLAKLSSMQAGGGTDLYPAMKAAYEASKGVPAQIKHFLVFTDGIVAPADFAGLTKEHDRRQRDHQHCRLRHGRGRAVPQRPGKMGNGNAYTANSLYDLPKIFTREVFLANKATLNEEPFAARPASDSPLVLASAGRAHRCCTAMSLLAERPRAGAAANGEGRPAAGGLALRLGQVARRSPRDAKNRWARDWLGWGGYSRFWTGVARWISSDLEQRRDDGHDLDVG